MLPKTSTPGAREALVDRFLDTIRPLRYTQEINDTFKSNLAKLMARAKTDLGRDFVSASPEKKLSWLKKTDEDAYDSSTNNPTFLRKRDLSIWTSKSKSWQPISLLR